MVCTGEMYAVYRRIRSSACIFSRTLMIYNTMIQKASLGIATSAWGPTFGKSKARTSPGYASQKATCCAGGQTLSRCSPFSPPGKKDSTLSGAEGRVSKSFARLRLRLGGSAGSAPPPIARWGSLQMQLPQHLSRGRLPVNHSAWTASFKHSRL